MTLSIFASAAQFEFGPLSQGWKERKKYELARALEGFLAVGFESPFGDPPFLEVDHLGVRIRNLAHLDARQVEELAKGVNRIYSQIMSEP